MQKEKKILIGSCTKVHGIKGAFKFYFYNRESEALKKGMQVEIEKDERKRTYIIDSISGQKKDIFKLKGIDDRNSSEALVPFDVYIARKDLPETKQGEFYYADLEGLKVIDEKGDPIGKVLFVYDHGAQIILNIETDTGEIDFPFIDHFILDLNFESSTLRVKMPEYIESEK